MPDFRWDARTRQGVRVRGKGAYADVATMRSELFGAGLMLTDHREADEGRRQKSRRVSVALSRRDRLVISQQLADALGAGISLVDSLTELANAYPKPRVRRLFGWVLQQVEAGSRLSEALANCGKAFPRSYVRSIEAAESSGRLADIFEDLANELEWQEEISGKVTSAMVYPMILLAAVIGISALFLFVLLPKFEPVFATLGSELPVATKALIAISRFIREYWYALVLLVPAAFAIRAALRHPTVRRIVDHAKLYIPALRALTRNLAVARFAASVSTLLQAGVPLPESLRISGAASNNDLFEARMKIAEESIVSGRGLTESLEPSGFFRNLDLRMIAMGERTGRLESTFASLARLYGKLCKRQIQAVVTMIEPMMIVVMAVVVLGLAMAILLPIYQSMDDVIG